MTCWHKGHAKSWTWYTVVAESRDLAGARVLVTRSTLQAQGLTQRIQRAGGIALGFPVLEILDPQDIGPLLAIIDRLDEFHAAVFVSPNAVSRSMQTILLHRKLPAGLQLVCVGHGSAQRLQQLGYANILVPEPPYQSETVLTLPALQQVAGKKIVVFQGNGGRDLLSTTLIARGAHVEQVECYRRVKPQVDAMPLIQAWHRGGVNVVTVSSTQGLQNLHEMLGPTGQPMLLRTPIVVLSERTAHSCRELGFTTEPMVASEACDEAVVQTLRAWRARQKSL